MVTLCLAKLASRRAERSRLMLPLRQSRRPSSRALRSARTQHLLRTGPGASTVQCTVQHVRSGQSRAEHGRRAGGCGQVSSGRVLHGIVRCRLLPRSGGSRSVNTGQCHSSCCCCDWAWLRGGWVWIILTRRVIERSSVIGEALQPLDVQLLDHDL